MKGVVNREVICDVRVSIGVDTHQDEQVIIALNQEGVRSARRAAALGAGGCQVDVQGVLLLSTNGRF